MPSNNAQDSYRTLQRGLGMSRIAPPREFSQSSATSSSSTHFTAPSVSRGTPFSTASGFQTLSSASNSSLPARSFSAPASPKRSKSNTYHDTSTWDDEGVPPDYEEMDLESESVDYANDSGDGDEPSWKTKPKGRGAKSSSRGRRGAMERSSSARGARGGKRRPPRGRGRGKSTRGSSGGYSHGAHDSSYRSSSSSAASSATCFRCHQTGHFANQCPQATPNINHTGASGHRSDQSAIICYSCQQPGHYASACPTKGTHVNASSGARGPANAHAYGGAHARAPPRGGSAQMHGSFPPCFRCRGTDHPAHQCPEME